MKPSRQRLTRIPILRVTFAHRSRGAIPGRLLDRGWEVVVRFSCRVGSCTNKPGLQNEPGSIMKEKPRGTPCDPELTPHQPRTKTIIPPLLSPSRTPHRQLLRRPPINTRHLAPLIELEPILKPNRISKRNLLGRIQIPFPRPLALGDHSPSIRSIRVKRESSIRSVLVTRVNTPLGEKGDDATLPIR